MEFIKIKTATELWNEYINDDYVRRSIMQKQSFCIITSTKGGKVQILWFVQRMYGQLGKILAVDGWDNVQKVKAGGWIWDEHWYSKIPEVNLDIKEIKKLI